MFKTKNVLSLFLATLFSVSFLGSPLASAWDPGTVPKCTTDTTAMYAEVDSSVVALIDASHSAYLIRESTNFGWVEVQVTPDEGAHLFTFAESSGDLYLSITRNATYHTYYQSFSRNPDTGVWTASYVAEVSSGSLTQSNAECFVFAQNVHYPSNYLSAGGIYYDSLPPNVEEQCTGWFCAPVNSILAFLSDIFDTVADISATILDGLADLFIPDLEVLQTSFEDFFDATKNQLGFLTYPFEFIVDFTTIVTADSSCAWVEPQLGYDYGGTVLSMEDCNYIGFGDFGGRF